MKQNYSIKQYLPIILVALIAVAFFVGRGCQPNSPEKPDSLKDSLNAEIRTLKAAKSETRTKTDTVEKIRTKYITRYKEVRHDSLIPCPEKLAACDTVVIQDSLTITLLKHERSLADAIIQRQDQVIHADSLTIVDLTKAIKKAKRRNKLLLGLSAVIGGVALLR